MKMKAVVLTGPGKVEYTDIERPQPKEGEVLVRVKTVGICGTDIELYNGTMPFFETGLSKYPLIPGHEWAGVVEDVGAGVTAFKNGDRVSGDVSIGCGKCVFCKQGYYNLCLNRREVGISGGKDGAYAEYVVMPAPYTYKLPDTVSFDAGAMIETTATVVKAIRHAPIPLGDITLVLGCGSVGLMGLQGAIAAGAGYTISADRQEPKLKIAREFGADRVVNTDEEDLGEVVKEVTGGMGVDYVMEASGSTALMARAPSLVRDAGIINAIGIYTSGIPEFDMSDIVLRNIRLFGSVASPNAYEATIRLVGTGRITPERCISHRFKLSEIEKAMAVQEQNPPNRIKILLYP